MWVVAVLALLAPSVAAEPPEVAGLAFRGFGADIRLQLRDAVGFDAWIDAVAARVGEAGWAGTSAPLVVRCRLGTARASCATVHAAGDPATPAVDAALATLPPGPTTAFGEVVIDVGFGREPADAAPEAFWQHGLAEAPLAEQVARVRARVRDHVLPLIGALERSVDPKFEGVIATGELVAAILADGRFDEERLRHDPRYWRGVFEMAPRNPLVIAAPTLVELADGRLDAAGRVLPLLRAWTEEDNWLAPHLEELTDALAVVDGTVERRVDEGIALFDAGKLDEAATAYRAILADDPHDAWARYELLLTLDAQAGGRPSPDLDAVQDAVFADDPLWPQRQHSDTPDEVFSTLRRLGVRGLFQGEAEVGADLVDLADIASDVGAPGLAAELYVLSAGWPGAGAADDRNADAVVAIARAVGSDAVTKLLGADRKAIAAAEARAAARRKQTADLVSGKARAAR